MTIVIPAVVACVGGAAYAFGSNKVAELGRIAYACGLFTLVLKLAERSIAVWLS